MDEGFLVDSISGSLGVFLLLLEGARTQSTKLSLVCDMIGVLASRVGVNKPGPNSRPCSCPSVVICER